MAYVVVLMWKLNFSSGEVSAFWFFVVFWVFFPEHPPTPHFLTILCFFHFNMFIWVIIMGIDMISICIVLCANIAYIVVLECSFIRGKHVNIVQIMRTQIFSHLSMKSFVYEHKWRFWANLIVCIRENRVLLSQVSPYIVMFRILYHGIWIKI